MNSQIEQFDKNLTGSQILGKIFKVIWCYVIVDKESWIAGYLLGEQFVSHEYLCMTSFSKHLLTKKLAFFVTTNHSQYFDNV